MLKEITITTEIALADMCYEIDARAQVFISNTVHYWEIESIAIDCNERIVRWSDLSAADREKILDAVNAEVAGPARVEGDVYA